MAHTLLAAVLSWWWVASGAATRTAIAEVPVPGIMSATEMTSGGCFIIHHQVKKQIGTDEGEVERVGG